MKKDEYESAVAQLLKDTSTAEEYQSLSFAKFQLSEQGYPAEETLGMAAGLEALSQFMGNMAEDLKSNVEFEDE